MPARRKSLPFEVPETGLEPARGFTPPGPRAAASAIRPRRGNVGVALQLPNLLSIKGRRAPTPEVPRPREKPALATSARPGRTHGQGAPKSPAGSARASLARPFLLAGRRSGLAGLLSRSRR